MTSWVADLGAALAVADGEAEARTAIQLWSRRLEAEDPFSADFYRANLALRMAGHLVVRDFELGERAKVVGLKVQAGEPFLSLEFTQAIEHFLSRRVVTPEEFAALNDEERFRSFTLSRVASQEVRDRAFELLNDAMRPGGVGLREFARQVRSLEVGLGIEPSSRFYLDTVYRTATAVSYGAGRYEQQTRPEVVAALPYWQYLTADDQRVRPAHAALHEKVWPVGDPEALRVYPPSGFRCRCTCVSVAEGDFDARMLSKQVSVSEAITPGFDGPPTRATQDDAGTAQPALEVPRPTPRPTPPPRRPGALPPPKIRPETRDALSSAMAPLGSPIPLLTPAQQRAARAALRRTIEDAGYKPRGFGADDDGLDVVDNHSKWDGVHTWDGRTQVVRSVANQVGKGGLQDPDGRGVRVLIHEELHGASPVAPTAYRRAGKLVEEVAVEVSARRILRALRGETRPVHELDPTDYAGYPASQEALGVRWRAYDVYLNTLLNEVEAVTGWDRRRAYDAVETASQSLLQGGDAAQPYSYTAKEHVERFVRGLPGVTAAKRRLMVSRLMSLE